MIPQRERSNSSATSRMCCSTTSISSRTPGDSRAPGRVTIANVSYIAGLNERAELAGLLERAGAAAVSG